MGIFHFKKDKGIIKESLDEILSINNKVLDLTERIYNAFTEEYKLNPFEKKGGEVREKTVAVGCEVFGRQMHFIFRCYNVLNPDQYPTLKSIHKFGNAEVLANYRVVINVGYLCGTLKTDIKPILQHEIEHVYQLTQGEVLHRHKSYKNSVNAYMQALTTLKSGEEKYESDKWKVAYVIYTHSENEIDGFANQLYQELTAQGDYVGHEKVLNSSNCFINYSKGKKYLLEMREDRERYEPVIESFGFTYEGFLDLYEKMNKRYISKIGKVITRYEDENKPIEICLNDLNAPGM